MNVLLIGGGWIAETVYVPFLNRQQSIDTIYIVDVDPEQIRSRYTNEAKVRCIASRDIADVGYEAVFILLPNYLHAETIQRFLKLNVRIFVEKPLCINQAELDELAAAIGDCPSAIHVSAPFRYRYDLQQLKSLLLSEEAGTIYHAEITWVKRRGTPGSAWFTQKELSGGGVLADMGPHLLDLFYWIFGYRKPRNYASSGSSLFLTTGDAYSSWHQRKSADFIRTDVEDSCFAFITYDDISLSLSTAWASNVENDYLQIRAWGTKSVFDAVTSVGFSTNILYPETQISVTSGSHPETIVLALEDRKEPFYKMLQDFMDGETGNIPNGREALHTTQDIFRLYDTMLLVRENR